MSEKARGINPEPISPKLSSPILSFGYRFRINQLGRSHLDRDSRISRLAGEYEDLDKRRGELAAFCEGEGLSEVITEQDFQDKEQKLSSLDSREAIAFLKAGLKHVSTGKRLIREANIYQRAQGKTGKSLEQLTENDLTRLGSDLALPSHFAEDENKFRTLALPEDAIGFGNEYAPDPSSTFNPKRHDQSEDQYPKDAAAFALHKEAILLDMLCLSLASRIGSNVGMETEQLSRRGRLDVAAGQMNRFSELPRPLRDWKERGLLDFDPRQRFYEVGFSERSYPAHEAALRILLPDSGYGNTHYEQYVKAKKKGLKEPRRSTERNNAKIEEQREWFLLRKDMYPNLLSTFTEVTEPTYSHVAKKALELAAYAISSKESLRANYGILISRDGKPLAESVGTLRALAYDEGLYLDPLLDKMLQRIDSEHLDPNEVADKLEKTNGGLKKHTEAGYDYDEIYFDLRTEEVSWFTEEAFCQTSALDSGGNYIARQRFYDRKNRLKIYIDRPPEVVDEIIKGLRIGRKEN